MSDYYIEIDRLFDRPSDKSVIVMLFIKIIGRIYICV